MQTVRVVPCLDVDAGRVVKGVNFVGMRDAGDPVELAARYDLEGADELVFLDITASSDFRDTTVDMVRRTAEEVFIHSPWGAASVRSRTPGSSCALEPTRCRSTRQPWTGRSWWLSWPLSSGASAWWLP